MKVVIPLAGLGTRLRPHTYIQPKPLVKVAGKPMLGHILDELASLEIEEIIFIIGHLGEQIIDYVTTSYPQYQVRFVEQKELSGQSSAIYLAEPYVKGELLVIFADTLFKANLNKLSELGGDAVLHLHEVADPSRFGVAVTDEAGRVVNLVEKPKTPVSKLAVVGVYYFRQAEKLFAAIKAQLEQSATSHGEFYLTDVMLAMIQAGAYFNSVRIISWNDCGTLADLLQTNRVLLAEQPTADLADVQLKNTTIIPPVNIAPNCRIEASVIGPFVSIDSGTVIRDAVLRNSIIGSGASIETINLDGSVVGNYAKLSGGFQSVNLSDHSELQILSGKNIS